MQDVHVAAMRRMEEKIRVLVEDLESEQKLRRRVEREKQDFQMQVGLLQLEAEGHKQFFYESRVLARAQLAQSE